MIHGDRIKQAIEHEEPLQHVRMAPMHLHAPSTGESPDLMRRKSHIQYDEPVSNVDSAAS